MVFSLSNRIARMAITTITLCIFICFSRASAQAAENETPRGIVIFIADDQGEGDLGCYGNDAVQTPMIDRFADQGMRFENAFLTISSCSPSRASILTGRYPHSTGAEDLHLPLPGDQRTAAYYLRRHGYFCAAIGKWHLGKEEKKNWDVVIECDAKVLAERTLQVFERRPKNKPFFFWVASKDPHRPFSINAIPQPHDPLKVKVPPYLPEHSSIREELALYYDEISRFDQVVGEVTRAVDRSGHKDDTLMIYLSDNGMPFPRAKATLYDSGIHTPLLVRWPAVVKPGSLQQGLVSSIDLVPTILDCLEIKQNTTQGKSLLKLLKNEKISGRDEIYAEANWHDFEKFTRAVRTPRYKLIRNYYWDLPLWNSVDSIHSITWKAVLEMKNAKLLTPAQAFLFHQSRPFEELYDLQNDPYELNNIAEEPKHQKTLWKLRAKLDNWRVETDDRMPQNRRKDGWTRDGIPLPHNQPWYDNWQKQKSSEIFK